MTLLFTRADKEAHLEAARMLTQSGGWMDDAYTLAAYDKGEEGEPYILRAIVVFQNINAQGCEIHFAGCKKGWATRPLLTSLFRFAFSPMLANHKMLRGFISENNTEALVGAIKSGFRFDGRLRNGAVDGSDAIILTMTREECRWLLPTHQRTETTTAPSGAPQT